MTPYINLLRSIVKYGDTVATGAFLPSENRQPFAKTLFAEQFRWDLSDGFPAVTTKKLYFDSVVKEMLWFLRGETNVKTLGCRIWDSWAGKNGYPEGECGPIYGEQWRRWPYPGAMSTCLSMPSGTLFSFVPTYIGDSKWDQVGGVVKDLKAVAADPNDRARRRIILTGWNPPLVPKMGLPPCHTMAQFLPTNGVLNTHCFWRSIDAPVGMPFNIAQYAFLTHLLCAVTGLKPGMFVASVTDLHVYDNQFEMVEEQALRIPFVSPLLVIDPEVARLAPDLSVEQVRLLDPSMFRLEGYKCHPPLKCEIAV